MLGCMDISMPEGCCLVSSLRSSLEAESVGQISDQVLRTLSMGGRFDRQGIE